MKIEIEIEDKYVNALTAQLALEADSEYDEQTIENVKNKCINETIKIEPQKLGEDSKQLQLALAMIAVGLVAEEMKDN